jgi:hypothetical protein
MKAQTHSTVASALSPGRQTLRAWLPALLLGLFMLLKMGLQYLLIDPAYDLHRDEYLHLDQGRHLAWGYVSVPPVTSWISWLILQLGNSVFWIKFFPALFGALTIAVVWKTVEALKGGLFAQVISAAAVTFSVLLRVNILYQPNSLEILLWTLFYFFFIKYIHDRHNKWLWLAACTLGLGFLNKYNIVFLMLGFLPALLLTEHRRVFRNPHLYYALALALLLISPNLIWQARSGFPVYHHLHELARTQLVHVDRLNFLQEQLLYFIGALFLLLAAFISFVSYEPFKKYRVFGWSFLFTTVLFLYLQAKAYYAIGLYPILIAIGAVYAARRLRPDWKRYLGPVLLFLPVFTFLPIYKAVFPVLSPAEIQREAHRFQALNLLRWEDGQNHHLPQDFADMLGWRELADKVDRAYDQLPDKSHTLVLCDNYGQAGAINYYSRHTGMQAVSLNADYIDWFPLDTMEVRNIILVQDARDTDKAREKEKPLFREVRLAGEIENPYAREKGTRIYILAGAKTSINAILRGDIANSRKRK